jgi:hypothetical protein
MKTCKSRMVAVALIVFAVIADPQIASSQATSPKAQAVPASSTTSEQVETCKVVELPEAIRR